MSKQGKFATGILPALVAALGIVTIWGAINPVDCLSAMAGAAILVIGAEAAMMLGGKLVDLVLGPSPSVGFLVWGDQRVCLDVARSSAKFSRGFRARKSGRYPSFRPALRLKSGVNGTVRRTSYMRGASRQSHRARSGPKASRKDSSGSSSSDPEPPPESTFQTYDITGPEAAATSPRVGR